MKKRKEWCFIAKVSRAKKKDLPVGAKIFDIAFTVFVYLLAVMILIGAIFFAFNTSQDKSVFGYRYYNVITPSMEPKYKVGDIVFVKLCSGDDVEVDDVITYNPDPNSSDTYLTHRVVKKYTEEDGTICFITKGDANNTADAAPIDEGRLIGKVTFGVPKMGYVIEFVKAKWYFILIIAILIGVFFKLLKHYFVLGKEEEEKKDEDDKTPSENDNSDSESGNNKSEDGNEEPKADSGGDPPVEDEDSDAADAVEEDSDDTVDDAEDPVLETSESGSEDGSSSEDNQNETSLNDE